MSERDRALNQAIEFIAREYCDPSLEPNGEWLPPEARKVHADLIAALSSSGGDVEEIARECATKIFGLVRDCKLGFDPIGKLTAIIAAALRSHAGVAELIAERDEARNRNASLELEAVGYSNRMHEAIARAEIAEEALANRKASAWQDISTAPKTGKTILAWGPYSTEPVTVVWQARNLKGYEPGWWAAHEGCLVIESQGDTWTDYKAADPLTHWMPLPAPPRSLPSNGDGAL